MDIMRASRIILLLSVASWNASPADAQSSLSEIAAQYGVELLLPFSSSSANNFGPGVVLSEASEGRIGNTRYLQNIKIVPCSSRILAPADESALNTDLEMNPTDKYGGYLAELISSSFAIQAGDLGAVQSVHWSVRQARVSSQPDNVLGAHLEKSSKTCPAIRHTSSVVVQSAATGDVLLVIKFVSAEVAQRATAKMTAEAKNIDVTEDASANELTIATKRTIIGLHWLPVSNYTP
jgi:hypothetical protein